MTISAELLASLVCPVDHAGVRAEGEELVCTACGRRYPVREGVAVMLEDAARMPASS